MTLPPQPIFQEDWSDRQIHYIPLVGNEPGSEIIAGIPEGMTEHDVRSNLANRRWIYIIGEVEYEDIFGSVRIQGYCLRIMDIVPRGLSAWRDGGHAYNRRQTGHKSPWWVPWPFRS